MTVHFIGAGPGAPDLLTLRGRDLIAASPVCLYAGSLVPEALLAHCPPGARIVNTAPLSLDAIIDEIAAAHAAGQDVARLHSGDLSIWSAMGEQLRRLRALNIPYDVTPGVPAFAALRGEGFDALAIVLIHGWQHRAHETRLAAIAREMGFAQVSVSHEVAPLIRLIPRGDTTVVDAYLSPVLRRYTDKLAASLPETGALRFMQSNGGLAEVGAFRGKDAILSGPAGGVVGMVAACEPLGHSRLIGFDMGGTSTDVSHYAGAFEREFETQVAGVRMRAPMMSIHTVAAGGGSILQFDGARFRGGPESAGANPGPASYRRGGPLAVTDANVMVGKVQPAHFPKVFGRAANEALDADVVREKFTAIAQPTGRTPEDVAHGFIQIAVQQMANAIKKISVARGYDVTKYTLQCFGGAGGQHACGVADALGMTRVLVHPLAGVLSAYGMGLADQNVMRETAVELKLVPEHITALRDTLGELALAAQHELEKQEVSRGDIRVHRRVHVRYDGTDSALIVPFPHLQGGDVSNQAVMHEITQAFEAAYRQRFAFLMQGKALIVEAVSVEAVVAGDAPSERAHDMHPQRAVPQRDTVRMYTAGNDGQAAWHDAALIVREDLRPGDVIDGPAIIAERNATTVLEPGWEASLTDRDGSLVGTSTAVFLTVGVDRGGMANTGGGPKSPSASAGAACSAALPWTRIKRSISLSPPPNLIIA